MIEYTEDRQQQLRAKYHDRNVLNITLVEIGWGLGMAFFVIDSIVNVFLKRLGASYVMLGVIPAFWAIGMFVPPILAGYFTQHLKRKKRMVIIWHIIPPAFIMAAGLVVYFGAEYMNQTPLRKIFLIWITIALMCGYWVIIGFLFPIYINFIQKVLDQTKRGLAFGSIFAAQCTFGALGTYFASHMLAGAEGTGEVAVYERYGLCFIVGAVIILFGNIFFFPIRELKERDIEPRAGMKKYLSSFVRIMKEEKNLRNYTFARYFIVTYVFYLYAYPSYLQEHYSWVMDAGGLAMLATFTFIGQALGYFSSGLLSRRIGYKAIALVGNLVLIADVIIFLHSETQFGFYIVGLLIGVFIGIERYYNFNLVIEICKKEDKTKYLVLATLLQAPAMAASVLIGGVIADNLGKHGFWYVTIGSGFLVVIGTIIMQFTVHLRREN